jgi:hypothetical protein
MKLLILSLVLVSCAAPPRLMPPVIYATQDAAYVLDIFGLTADGRMASMDLPRR